MENSGRRLQVRLWLEQDGEYKTAQNLQEVETVVNYSTPARSPWMLYPRVKTVPRVLWAGLTDGVKMYSMGPLCVCVCVCVILQVGETLLLAPTSLPRSSYFLSSCGDVALSVSLNCCTNDRYINQEEHKTTSNLPLHVVYLNEH